MIYVDMQSYLIFAEDISLGDAVQQGVRDLARCASHHVTDGFGLKIKHNMSITQTNTPIVIKYNGMLYLTEATAAQMVADVFIADVVRRGPTKHGHCGIN